MHESNIICRWLDAGEEDGKIERELEALPLEEPLKGRGVFYMTFSLPLEKLLCTVSH